MRLFLTKNNCLRFLYAYLRQLDLSLDRSRWDKFDRLKVFFQKTISPNEVADALMKFFNLDKDCLNAAQHSSAEKSIPFGRLILSLFSRRMRLKSIDVCFCCQNLYMLDFYLRSEEEIDRLEIEKLRINFSTLAYQIIRPKLRLKDIRRADRIEHYLQNDGFDPLSIWDYLDDNE